MDSNHISSRNLRVLCWNVRGLNSEDRQRAVRQKIDESQCSVVCLEETKMQHIDNRAIRSFAPKRFVFAPQWVHLVVLWFYGTLQCFLAH